MNNTAKLFIIACVSTAFIASCSQPTANNTKAAPGSNTAARVNANSSQTTVNAAVSDGGTTAGKPAGAGNSAPSLRAAGREEPLEASGSDLYKQNCMICHKDTGKGGKITIEGKSLNPIDLTSARTKAKSDDKLLAEIKEGMPDDGMPAFGAKLSDEQITMIISHFRTLK